MTGASCLFKIEKVTIFSFLFAEKIYFYFYLKLSVSSSSNTVGHHSRTKEVLDLLY